MYVELTNESAGSTVSRDVDQSPKWVREYSDRVTRSLLRAERLKVGAIPSRCALRIYDVTAVSTNQRWRLEDSVLSGNPVVLLARKRNFVQIRLSYGKSGLR